MILIKIIVALLPAILLLAFIYWKDAKKEPVKWLAKAFLWGAAVAIPLMIIEWGISFLLFGSTGEPTTLLGSTAEAFLVASLPEEAAKLFVLWLVLRKNPYFDEHFDGIVYAVFVGLGFAAFENIGYVLQHDDWLGIGAARALLAVPGHYAYAVIMGYSYAIYHFVDKSKKNAFFILFMPFMAHGIYDSIVMGIPFNPIVYIISIPALIYFTYKMQRIAYKRIVLLSSSKDNVCD